MTQTSTISTANDYLDPLLAGVSFSTTSTAIRDVGFVHSSFDEEKAERKARKRDLKETIVRTFRASNTVLSLGSQTAESTEGEDVYIGDLRDSEVLDKVRRVVRGFEEVPEGWDGPDSKTPITGVIQDALEVLQNWVSDIHTPEPVLAFDGTVALELYEEGGLTRGGVEFLGQHQAVFTVVSQSKLVVSGTFNAESPGDIIRSITKIKRALSSK